MVRTRAENTGRRAVGAKAPRKQLGGGSSSSSVVGSPGGKDKHSGGNPVRWTPTPSWQKGIGSFFLKTDTVESSAGESSSSKDFSSTVVTPCNPSDRNQSVSSNPKQCSSGVDEGISSLEE